MSKTTRFWMFIGILASLVRISSAVGQSTNAEPAFDLTVEQRQWMENLRLGKEVGPSAAKLYYAQVKPAYPLFYEAWSQAEPALKIQLLGFIANRRMPRWEEVLHVAAADDRRELRVEALRYFQYLDADAKTIGRLRTTLGDADREVRWMAAKALAQMPAAVVELRAEVKSWIENPDVLLRQPLLANIVPSDKVLDHVEPYWLAALANPDAMTRMSAAEGLQRLKTFAPARLRNGVVEPRSEERGKLCDSLLNLMIKDLGHADAALAGASMYALVALGSPALEQRIVEMLSSDELPARARAAEVLRKRKAAFDPSLLSPVFERGDETLQLFVCGTLGRVQTAACAPVAAKGLASKHPSVRQAMLYTLENLPANVSGPILIQALKHEDPNVRRRTATILGRRRDTDALAALDHVAELDADVTVRDAARRAAAIVGGRDLAKILVDRKQLLEQTSERPVRKFDLAPGGIPIDVEGVMQIDSHKQLFVDDLIVASIGTAERKAHSFRKDPRNPIFEQEYPWERQGTLTFVSSVHYDIETRLFIAWYHSMLGAPDATKGELGRTPLIAYSVDGIHWQRPLIGQKAWVGSKTNNVVGTSNNIVPIPAAKDPTKRYASYVFHPEKNALAVAYSPDGIGEWTEFKAVCGGGRDVVTACRDDLGGGYFAFMKWRLGPWSRRSAWAAWGPTPDAMTRGPINITADLTDDQGSANRIAAAFPTLDYFQPSQFHTEIYEVTPFIYEGHYFGLPMRFDVSGRGGGNIDGITDVMLIASRDKQGKQGWQRPAGSESAPLLALGRWGEWDSGQIYGPNGLLVVDDEIVFYYTGACFGHEPEGSKSDGEGNSAYRAAIGRATLRLDGLVSLHADDTEATIATKKLRFLGSRLQVNAACAQGTLLVEMCDAAGAPIPGFTFADCDPFIGDALRHVVSWRGKSDLSGWAGKAMQVRFRLRNGDLYAMQFTIR
ncbi:MAG: HEAT repeat domain-containing protein [Planctomycetia bacterium]|nr:HEAT repeat domain-containing protein [Planctomycetia bacterium]